MGLYDDPGSMSVGPFDTPPPDPNSPPLEGWGDQTPPPYTPPTNFDTGGPPGGDPTGGYLGTGVQPPTGTIGDPSGLSWWQRLLGSNSSFGAGGGGFGGSGGGTVAGATIPQWLQAINTLIASGHKGQFVQVPQTPEQKALYDWAVQRLTSMPDNTANLYGYAASRAFASPKFDINAAMRGQPAYTPSQPLTPQQIATLIAGYGGTYNPGGKPSNSTDQPTTPFRRLYGPPVAGGPDKLGTQQQNQFGSGLFTKPAI